MARWIVACTRRAVIWHVSPIRRQGPVGSCIGCGYHFSVKSGTHHARIRAQDRSASGSLPYYTDWGQSKKGMSAHQLHRTIWRGLPDRRGTSAIASVGEPDGQRPVHRPYASFGIV